MSKSEAQIGETTIEIDTAELEKRLTENMDQKLKPMFEKYLEKVKSSDDWK